MLYERIFLFKLRCFQIVSNLFRTFYLLLLSVCACGGEGVQYKCCTLVGIDFFSIFFFFPHKLQIFFFKLKYRATLTYENVKRI